MTEGDAPAEPVVVDTMVFSAQFVPGAWDRAPLYEPHVIGRRVIVSFVTVEEVWYGALSRNWGQTRRRQVEERLQEVAVAPYAEDLVMTAARLRSDCRAAGHPLHQKIHAADRWIAATARHLQLPLVTDDRVFINTPGIDVITEQKP